MNKFFKKLAVVLSFVLVFAAMPMSVFAVETTVAKIGEESFTTLANAVAAAKGADGVETIELLTDVTLDGILTIQTPVTIAGNGKRIIGNVDDGYSISVEGTSVTLNNLTVAGKPVQFYKSTGHLENVKVESSTASLCLNVNASKVTFNGFDGIGKDGTAKMVNVSWGEGITGTESSFSGQNISNVSAIYSETGDVERAAAAGATLKVAVDGYYKAYYYGMPMYSQGTPVAQVGSQKYLTLDAAVKDAPAGETVTLLEGVELAEGIAVTKNVTLNLNGKTLSAADNQPSTALLKVENAKLIITGNGVIDSASQGNDYGMAVWARNAGAEVEIVNGRFTNLGSKDKEDNGNANNNELIYASNGGKITIKDGEFIGNKNNTTYGTRYTLNITDNTASVISVEGGKYYDYDPADSKSENPAGNFVATGYVSVKEGEYWVVKDKASLEHKVEAEVPVIDNTKQEAQATVDTTANAGAVEAAAKQVLDVLNNENTTVTEKQTAIDNLAIDADAKTALKEAVATEKEVTVIIEVGAKEMDSTEIAAEQAKVDAIDSKLDNGETVAAYLDLSVTKSIAVNGVEIAGTETELTEIPQPLAFTVAYPKDVPAVPEGMVRVWVYTVHTAMKLQNLQ